MAVTNFVPLAGSTHKPLANSRSAGPVDQSEIASITVRTRPAAKIEHLEKTVNEIYSQPLDERKYLSREQLSSLQAASAADLNGIEEYAQQHNLVVSHRSDAERSVVLTGTLADLLRAFPADLYMVHHAAGSYRL